MCPKSKLIFLLCSPSVEFNGADIENEMDETRWDVIHIRLRMKLMKQKMLKTKLKKKELYNDI